MKKKIGHWFVMVVVVSVNSALQPDEFMSNKVTSYLQPYMDTIRVVPTNSSDIVYVHSMFRLLYGKGNHSIEND